MRNLYGVGIFEIWEEEVCLVRDKKIIVGRYGGWVGLKKILFMELLLSYFEVIILGYCNGMGIFIELKNIILYGGIDN